MIGKEGFCLHINDGVWYYTIASFDDTGLVRNGFSTRKGGVSTGQYGTLNLGLKKSDSREAVMENFSRFCRAIGLNPVIWCFLIKYMVIR